MSNLAGELPFREIWLDPFCADCWTPGTEITWCQHDVYDPCPTCGRKAIRYAIDRRQTRFRMPKGATP
jgi:predicted RNA-binding Zn-ribbon protein involved in translation (DUF1610 family)